MMLLLFFWFCRGAHYVRKLIFCSAMKPYWNWSIFGSFGFYLFEFWFVKNENYEMQLWESKFLTFCRICRIWYVMWELLFSHNCWYKNVYNICVEYIILNQKIDPIMPFWSVFIVLQYWQSFENRPKLFGRRKIFLIISQRHQEYKKNVILQKFIFWVVNTGKQ